MWPVGAELAIVIPTPPLSLYWIHVETVYGKNECRNWAFLVEDDSGAVSSLCIFTESTEPS